MISAPTKTELDSFPCVLNFSVCITMLTTMHLVKECGSAPLKLFGHSCLLFLKKSNLCIVVVNDTWKLEYRLFFNV